MKRIIIVLGISAYIQVLWAQSSESTLQPVSSDCRKAVKINISRNSVYGPTDPPAGFGDIQEFPSKKPLLFEKEHHTAWYLLSIARTGDLVLEVVPENSKDDYDFVIYSYDGNTCKDIFTSGIVPVRSNLSRVDRSILGITGLMANVKLTHVGMGIGNAYCKSLPVEAGENYMLVVDNVYPEGKGHTLYFNYVKQVEIKGKIVDSDNEPLQAEIVLSDNFGNVVDKVRSDAKGEYDLKTFMKEGEDYNLSSQSSTTFIDNKTLNTNKLKAEQSTFEQAQTILPVLKQGAKYNLGNITFYGNMAELIPASYPAVESLYNLLKQNEKLVIQIEGHVNKGTVKTKKDELFNQELSEQRAVTIYNYLVKKGISKERLSTVGLSASQMIYVNPKNEQEQEANRRVEIKITSMN